MCQGRDWDQLGARGQDRGKVLCRISWYLTQPLLCSLQISIFIYPSDAPHSVHKELKSEKVEQTKLMQIQE